MFPEMSSYRNDIHINQRYEYNGEFEIKSDEQLSEMLSFLIKIEDTDISENKRYLYCELLFISKEIQRMVTNGEKLTPMNMRYLFIVYYHYTLDNPLVMLIRDLIKDQEFFMRRIKRIFNYPCFRDWITVRNQLNEHISYSLYDARNNKWNKTELYNCFRCELYRTGLYLLFR